MNYYYSKKLPGKSFDEIIEKITEALKKEGFGILTEINVRETLKKKLDEDFRPYVILGACNPPYAFRALQAEDKIGTMLPCNVIVQQLDTSIEVAAVSPLASMQAVSNDELKDIAVEIEEKLRSVIDEL